MQRCMVQMLILAGPGVLVSTFCLGSALKVFSILSFNHSICVHDNICNNILQFTFPYDWSWKTSLLLGGLLSATDPVAVVALLKELGAGKKLSTIIEGESLMNDGYQDSMFCFSFLSNCLYNLLFWVGHMKSYIDFGYNDDLSLSHCLIFWFSLKMHNFLFPGQLLWSISYSIKWSLARALTLVL